jgi:segregation and condensation protein A
MAATLIEIKSKMLLPREISSETEEETEDPRQELIDRLLEHQKFKNAAEMLYERVTVEQAVFTRGQIESDENNTETNATVFDLLKVFQKILERHKEEVKMEIEREEISLAEMIERIKAQIFKTKQVNLLDVFRVARNRQELVLTFIAVLELIRTQNIQFVQTEIFGDVILKTI